MQLCGLEENSLLNSVDAGSYYMSLLLVSYLACLLFLFYFYLFIYLFVCDSCMV